ncbi:hypothetical protein EJ110_NYTH40788 [Nymphaea thermarum]|nr:hypothetical protein EJ110_NYTH40788 [Nymphaea thermarum]
MMVNHAAKFTIIFCRTPLILEMDGGCCTSQKQDEVDLLKLKQSRRTMETETKMKAANAEEEQCRRVCHRQEQYRHLTRTALLAMIISLLLVAIRHLLFLLLLQRQRPPMAPPILFLLLHVIVGSILITSMNTPQIDQKQRKTKSKPVPEVRERSKSDEGSGDGEGEGDDDLQVSAEEVNAKVEAFIANFRRQLVMQRRAHSLRKQHGW